MNDQADPISTHPTDICVLLRAYAEQRWLSRKVVPLLSELERTGSADEPQLGAALAYLEVLWLDARRRAAETDASFAALLTSDLDGSDEDLHLKAQRYHAAVRGLRRATEVRVLHALDVPAVAEAAQPAH
jgi:hypothetical protein